MQPVRWGIIGSGHIARKFAEDLTAMPEARLVAVGSRSTAAAESFGARWGATRRHGSYAALAQDKEVEAVYVAVPHPFHAENSLLCLEAGKAVLCEKPFALNASQAAEVIRRARAGKLLVMEGMWTRAFPVMARLRQLLADEAVGRVRLVAADFSFRREFSAEGRHYNRALGGGALLDVGVYPVSLASMILGPPERICSAAEMGGTGVDYQAAMIFHYQNGAAAALYAGLRAQSPCEAEILGESGSIKVHGVWWKPSRMTVTPTRGKSEEWNMPYTGNGYQYEAAEFMNCLREGRLESAIMPLDETLSIMKTLDAARAPWGLRYPGE
jgi:predicted dehydrogenase